MAKIYIESANIRRTLSSEESLAKKLQNLSQSVGDIRTALNYKIAGREQISARLRQMTEDIMKESTRATAMRNALEQIVTQYEHTEDKNASLSVETLTAQSESISGGNPDGGDENGYEYVHFAKSVWDVVVKQLSNLMGPFAFVASGVKTLAGGGDYAQGKYWNDVLKSLGKFVSKIPNKDKISKSSAAEWAKELFGYTQGTKKSFGEAFAKKVGDFSTPAKAIGTAVTWATAFFDRAFSNLKEAKETDMSMGRFWGETVSETIIKVGAGALIGAGVAAAMGSAPVVAVGAVTIGATMLVDWGLNNLTSWVTNGAKTDWIDALSDGVIDGGKWLVEKTGAAVKKGAEAVKNIGEKAAHTVSEGVGQLKGKISNLFSGCRWGELCVNGGGGGSW